MDQTTDNTNPQKTVCVGGQGNVGSQLVGHVARMPIVRRMTCVDPDVYSAGNLGAQEISEGDVGAAKALAAARRLRAINQAIQVTAIVDRVENVPWGQLRADVIIGCVDNKDARAAINRVARRLGLVYIDVAIRADGLLARVDVYGPRPEDACVQCAWGAADYESLGRTFSCTGELRDAPSTGASSALGGMAAAMAAMECQKILEGAPIPAGKQVVIESACHHAYLNTLRRNPNCRFGHNSPPIHPVSADTLGELGEAASAALGETAISLSVEARTWLTKLMCPACGQPASVLTLQGRVSRRLARCSHCGQIRQPVGFDMLPRLDLGSARRGLLNRPLSRLGLSIGDVVRVSSANREESFELVR